MWTRIEINEIVGDIAFGSLLFADNSVYPIQMPVTAYDQLCEKGFFQYPPDLPPDGEMPLNISDIYETPETTRANHLEGQFHDQRLF